MDLKLLSEYFKPIKKETTLIESALLGTLLSWNDETQSEFLVFMASEDKHLQILREWDL